jgi:hypothetical protein
MAQQTQHPNKVQLLDPSGKSVWVHAVDAPEILKHHEGWTQPGTEKRTAPADASDAEKPQGEAMVDLDDGKPQLDRDAVDGMNRDQLRAYLRMYADGYGANDTVDVLRKKVLTHQGIPMDAAEADED